MASFELVHRVYRHRREVGLVTVIRGHHEKPRETTSLLRGEMGGSAEFVARIYIYPFEGSGFQAPIWQLGMVS